MISRRTFTIKLEKALSRAVIYIMPYLLILGIIDYRFHTYYWKSLNSFRPFRGGYLFDFFSVYDVFIGVLVIAGLLLCALDKKSRSQFLQQLRRPIVLVSGVLFCIGLVVAKFSFTPTPPQIHGLHSILVTNYLTPLASAALLCGVLTHEYAQRKFLLHLSIALSVLGLGTLCQFFFNILPGASEDFLHRAVWPYIDPFVGLKPESANWLSYLFAPLFLINFYQLTESKKERTIQRVRHTSFEKITLILGSAVGLTVVIASKSYTGLGALMAVVALYSFKRLRKNAHRIAAVAIVVVLAGSFVFSQRHSQKFQILLGNYKKENSIQRRIQIYTVTKDMLSAHPLRGVGVGNYQSSFRLQMKETLTRPLPDDEVPPHPHNLILYFWSELGVAGLLFILSIYSAIVVIWYRKNPSVGLLPLTYVLLHGFLDVPYGLSEASTLFFIWISCVVINYRQVNAQTIDPQPKHGQNVQ